MKPQSTPVALLKARIKELEDEVDTLKRLYKLARTNATKLRRSAPIGPASLCALLRSRPRS